MDVTIERNGPEHFDGFYRALDTVARERKYLAFLEGPPVEVSRAFVLDNIARGSPQFVALANGEVVGWCDITPIARPIYAHCGTLGMGLLPTFRGCGLGRRLIETTLADARRIGLLRVELTVHADNARAIALYARVGFTLEGVKRDAALIDGQFKDVNLMAIVWPRTDGSKMT